MTYFFPEIDIRVSVLEPITRATTGKSKAIILLSYQTQYNSSFGLWNMYVLLFDRLNFRTRCSVHKESPSPYINLDSKPFNNLKTCLWSGDSGLSTYSDFRMTFKNGFGKCSLFVL